MRKLNMTYKYLEFVVEEGLATITLNRPKRLNALSAGMIDELYEAVTHVATDSDIKACLLYTSPSPRDRTRSRMPSSA